MCVCVCVLLVKGWWCCIYLVSVFDVFKNQEGYRRLHDLCFYFFFSLWEARFSWSWYFALVGPLMWIICEFRMAIGIVSGLWSVE